MTAAFTMTVLFSILWR